MKNDTTEIKILNRDALRNLQGGKAKIVKKFIIIGGGGGGGFQNQSGGQQDAIANG